MGHLAFRPGEGIWISCPVEGRPVPCFLLYAETSTPRALPGAHGLRTQGQGAGQLGLMSPERRWDDFCLPHRAALQWFIFLFREVISALKPYLCINLRM